MANTSVKNRPYFYVVPVLSLVALFASWSASPAWPVLMVLAGLMTLTVFVAVHHAEVVALKVGEPFGSLILAVAVTAIEVGMIVVLMFEDPAKTANLARDTVFSAVMISTNGIVGAALLIKTLKNRVANFNASGAAGALAAIGALSVLSLVLPSVTISSPGPKFTPVQLAFAAITSLTVYAVFVTVQTVRHRDYFLPPTNSDKPNLSSHVKPPETKVAVWSFVSLCIALVGVVGLAKVTSPLIKVVVDEFDMPKTVVALAIALVVLAPEFLSAIRAAISGRTQTSMNLAYGSAIASIGLTIPVIAVMSLVLGFQVNLGLNSAETTLLSLTLFVSTLTVLQGKATLLQASVHLTIFGSYLLLAFIP